MRKRASTAARVFLFKLIPNLGRGCRGIIFIMGTTNQTIENSTGIPCVNSLAKYIQQVEEIKGNYSKSVFAYRGHYLKKWAIIPTIGRKGKDALEQEYQMYLQFKKGYACLNERCFYIPTKKMDWLFLEQHYGIPTRLLDWTLNPLVALFFACYKDKETEDSDGQVLIMHMEKGQGLKEEEKDINPFESGTLKDIENQFIIPDYFDQRLRNQQAAFTITSKPEEEAKIVVKKIDIDNSSKESILKELATYGITEDFIYPTLDRLCERITKEFIKDNTQNNEKA